jgi:murein DD-endopeptidase MepM/ murein hydrolase activator NlpD
LKTLLKFILFFILLLGVIFFAFSFISSSVTKNVDSYIYNLPFKENSKYRVVQGYGGLFSHFHTAALDFEMPVGTPIYAAREGLIYSYKDNSNEGGPLPKLKRKANYIIIKHSDGSFGCYWHLQKNGVTVNKGIVKKGQLIGYSGNTGFVLRPHLHFSVKRILNYEKDSFVKTKFKTKNGVEFLKSKYIYERPAN